MTNKRARKSKSHACAPSPAKRGGPNATPAKILDVLEGAQYPLNLSTIARRMGILKSGESQLEKPLSKLTRALKIVNIGPGYVITNPSRLIHGTIKTTRQGSGFIVPDAHGAQEGFLTEQSMAGLFDGDRVTGYLTSNQPMGGKIEAKLLRVESLPPEILSTVCLESGRAVAKPLHAEGGRFSLMEGFGDSLVRGLVGLVVRVRLLERPVPGRETCAEVVQVIGDPREHGVICKVAMIENDIVEQFGDKAIREAEQAEQPALTSYRKDLTDVPFFTIDDDNTNDLDDALAGVVRSDGSVTVYVAIADVSEMIKPGSLLDRVARQRATSVYLPGLTIPLLPPCLGRKASLLPLERRAAVVVRFKFAPDGSLSSTKIIEAWVQSKARISYNAADALIEAGQFPSAPTEVLHSIACVDHSSASFRQATLKDAEGIHAPVTSGPGTDHLAIPRTCPGSPSRDLVRLWMVAANHAAATLLSSHGAPALFRVHEMPSPQAIGSIGRTLEEAGVAAPAQWDAEHLERLYQELKGHPRGLQLSRYLAGLLPAARYADEPGLHASLAKDAYAHFTSPIRRYADIVNHRAIKAIIRRSKRLSRAETGLGREMTTKRQSAYAAEKAVNRAVLGRALLDQRQPSLPGTVTGTQKFGCFVRLNDYPGLDGLVHISCIDGQTYHFDEACGVLEGARNRQRISAGSQVQVRLNQVCPWSGRIEMSILS